MRHEIKRVGIDDGEGFGGQLVDTTGGEIGVERQPCCGKFAYTFRNAALKSVLGTFAEDQRLLFFECARYVAQLAL